MEKTLYVIIVLMMVLVACEEDVTPTPPSDTPSGPATGVAINPPRVWIDRPLSGDTLIVGRSSSQIVAHAAALDGNAQLEVRDDSNQLLATMDLGTAIDSSNIGGLLNRYESDWQAIILPLLENSDGPLVLNLTVIVNGIPSNPITVTFELATPTPTATSTPTIRPSATNTATDVPVTSTVTPTATATRVPEVAFVPKGTLEPCAIVPSRGLQVGAMLAPGRDTVLFIVFPDRYDVTGKTNRFDQLWWQIFLPQTQNAAFVRANQVMTSGSCALVQTVVPPIVEQFTPAPVDTREVEAGQPTIEFFTTSSPTVSDSTCATMSWSVVNVDAVYLNGEGVVGNGSRTVCAEDFGYGDVGSLDFTLTITKDGAIVDSRTIRLSYSHEEEEIEPTVAPPTATPTIDYYDY